MSKFGNEKKVILDSALSVDKSNTFIWLAKSFDPVILKISLWENHPPFHVPPRKINDEFCLFVAEGKCRMTVNQETRILETGDCVLLPIYTEHSYSISEDCEKLSFYIIHILFDNFNISPFKSFISPFQKLTNSETFLSELHDLTALSRRDFESASILLRYLLKNFITEKIIADEFVLNEGKQYSRRIQAALRYIQNQFTASIGIRDIAEHINLKPARFRKIFGDEVGITPSKYLKQIRLFAAARELARYDDPLSVIADKSGFSSENYLCLEFKRHYGMTPKDFRLRMRE